MMRPSSSGNATFIAMSRASRPRAPARQLGSSPPEKITCSTGQSGAAKGLVSPAPVDTANAVAFSTMSGGASPKTFSMIAAESASFSDDTKIGNGLRPRA